VTLEKNESACKKLQKDFYKAIANSVPGSLLRRQIRKINIVTLQKELTGKSSGDFFTPIAKHKA